MAAVFASYSRDFAAVLVEPHYFHNNKNKWRSGPSNNEAILVFPEVFAGNETANDAEDNSWTPIKGISLNPTYTTAANARLVPMEV